MGQLSVAENKLSAVLTRLAAVDKSSKKLEMDEKSFVPEGLGYTIELFEEEEKVCLIFLLYCFFIHTYIFSFRKRKMMTGSNKRIPQETIKFTSGCQKQKAWRKKALKLFHMFCILLVF